MAIDPKYIWMDGELVEAAKATVSFLSSGLHYGAGVFEGIRCYQTDRGPAIFRNTEHMERLVDSAKVLGFRSLPYTVEEFKAAARLVVKVNGYGDCYVRPLIYASGILPSLNLDKNVPKVGVAAWEWGAYLGEEAREKGVRANISSFTRHHPNVNMTKAKITGNYANSILAKTESIRLGFDEAILLDPQGYVAECSGENLFVVRRGIIYTTPTAPILEGITRDALFTLAKDLGIAMVEAQISRDQLYIADEVFVCGTAAEVVAVREVDSRVIGAGKMGPVTKAMQDVFHTVVRGQHPRSAAWLDYVE